MPDKDHDDDEDEDEDEESTPAATTHVTTRHRKRKSGGGKELLGISNDQLAIGAALTSLGIAVALAYKQFGEPYLQNMQQQQLEDQRRNYYLQQQQYEQQRQKQLEDQEIAEEDERIERARQLKAKSRIKGAATPEEDVDENDLTFSNNKNVSGSPRITGNENVQNVKTGITEEMERRNKEKAAIMKKRGKTSPFGNAIGNLNL